MTAAGAAAAAASPVTGCIASPAGGAALPPSEDTNVHVAARIRPLLAQEQAGNCCSCVTVHQSTRQVVVGTRRTFAFDMVFDIDATQAEVYDQCVSPLLQGCMQGYNATILAYGQTGSGKTHTMGTGQACSTKAATSEGITPKVIRDSFEFLEQAQHVVHFKASCCYLEIYNEEIRDLLQPSSGKSGAVIRENPDGVIQVVGLHAEQCRSAQDMLRCLNDGSVQRTTGATLMNEQSSRSHSIFTVILEQQVQKLSDNPQSREQSVGRTKMSEGDAERRGTSASSYAPAADGGPGAYSVATTYQTAKFHLVDLAGSERAKRTGAVGSRFKESVAINAGLLALGNVISALGDPAKRGCHVPYRESKLTRLLQDSLGGNSRTLMIACASCSDSNFEETMNTLKYAHRARNIKNKPVVNHDPRVAQLAALQDENDALRRELRRVAEECSVSLAAPGAGGGAMSDSAAESDEVMALSLKLRAAEGRNAELLDRLGVAESDREAMRLVLADVYGAVCQHLSALWQAPRVYSDGGTARRGSSSSTSGESADVLDAAVCKVGDTSAGCVRGGRHALSALCETLQAARRSLGNVAVNCDLSSESVWRGFEALQVVLLVSRSHLSENSGNDGATVCFSDLLGSVNKCSNFASAPIDSTTDHLCMFGDIRHSPGGREPVPQDSSGGQLKSLSDMRRDSTSLIKKYLDEMSRLEEELCLYRRRTKLLEEQLREAKDDLQKDEDIFDEKMQEMKVVIEQNELLKHDLWELSQVPSAQTEDRHHWSSACVADGESTQSIQVQSSDQDSQQRQQQRRRQLQHRQAENGLREEESIFANRHSQEGMRAELEKSQVSQDRLQHELHILAQNVSMKEDLLKELVQSEHEWSTTKARYQQRMDQLQRDLERMNIELETLHGQRTESSKLKEQTRTMEEEKRRLQKRIAEQEEFISNKEREFGRLRELRRQDGCKIRELEEEVKQLKSSQSELHRKLQSERCREARNVSQLHRSLEGSARRVRNIETQHARQSHSLMKHQMPPSQRSPRSVGVEGDLGESANSALHDEGQPVGSPAASDRIGFHHATEVMGAKISPGGPALTKQAWPRVRVERFEQRIDEYIRRQETWQGLEEDLRKRETLLTKREQYLSYRAKIADRIANKKRPEAAQRIDQIMARLAGLDAELRISPDIGESSKGVGDPAALIAAHVEVAIAERAALNEERMELESVTAEERRAEAIVQDIDERMEGLQDEIDFREARIAKARYTLNQTPFDSFGTASEGAETRHCCEIGVVSPAAALGDELASITREDARELLCRCCEKLVRQRQSERQTCKRLAACEAQSDERARQVYELQNVLKQQDSNSTKVVARLTKRYEEQIRSLYQQLSAAQQAQSSQDRDEIVGLGQSNSGPRGATCDAAATTVELDATSEAELQQLKKDNQYYKAVNRELKRKLRDAVTGDGMGRECASHTNMVVHAGSSANR